MGVGIPKTLAKSEGTSSSLAAYPTLIKNVICDREYSTPNIDLTRGKAVKIDQVKYRSATWWYKHSGFKTGKAYLSKSESIQVSLEVKQARFVQTPPDTSTLVTKG